MLDWREEELETREQDVRWREKELELYEGYLARHWENVLDAIWYKEQLRRHMECLARWEEYMLAVLQYDRRRTSRRLVRGGESLDLPGPSGENVLLGHGGGDM